MNSITRTTSSLMESRSACRPPRHGVPRLERDALMALPDAFAEDVHTGEFVERHQEGAPPQDRPEQRGASRVSVTRFRNETMSP